MEDFHKKLMEKRARAKWKQRVNVKDVESRRCVYFLAKHEGDHVPIALSEANNISYAE